MFEGFVDIGVSIVTADALRVLSNVAAVRTRLRGWQEAGWISLSGAE